MATDLSNLTGTVGVDATITTTKTHDLSTTTDPLAFRPSLEFTFGSGASQANMIFHDTYTIAFGASQTIDLVDILNPFGVACSFGTLKAVIVYNKSATAEITVGNGTFAGWQGAAANLDTVKAGGVMLHACTGTGWTVAGGADEIKITNTHGSLAATVDVVIIGTATA